jgi:hypothetical protein
MDFTGMQCIVCRKEFSPDDDIVVCETCGTPYHRECYKSVGKCVNIEYHAEGLTFNQMHRKVEEVVTISDISDSKSEDDDLKDTYIRAVEVSSELIQQVNLSPYEEHDGVNLLEFYLYTKSLISTKKFHKYSIGKSVFSWLGFIFPTYYLASKRLYVQAVVSFLIEFIITIPLVMASIPVEVSQTLTDFTSTNAFAVATVVSLVLDIIFRKTIADKSIVWSFRDTIDKIKAIKRANPNTDDTYTHLLDNSTNTNFLAVLVAFICSNLAYYSFAIMLILVFSYLGL